VGEISPARAASGWKCAGGMAFRAKADVEASSRVDGAWTAIQELLGAWNSPVPGTNRRLIEDYTLDELKPLYKKLKEAVAWRENSDTYSSFSTLERRVEKEMVAHREYDEMGLLDLEEEVRAKVVQLKKKRAIKCALVRALDEPQAREQSCTKASLPAGASIVDAVFAAHEARTRARR
jgi:hypothetical protein